MCDKGKAELMHVNKYQNEIQTNYTKNVTPQKEQKKPASLPVEQKIPAPVNSGLYQAYNNISFKGKPYNGTNFRTDLEKRAEQSQTKLRLFPKFDFVKNPDNYQYIWQPDKNTPEQELQLFKTKHSEYVKSPDGAKIYKVRYVSDKDRIIQQVIASKLYNSVGVRTPEYIAFEKNGKTGYLVEVLEEELFDANTNPKALYDSFVADVWLGNRNGLSKGNTKIDKDGNPVKMSVSGSLNYRASGKPKEEKLDYPINEIDTMRDYSINPEAASALSQMSDEELYEAAEAFFKKYDSTNCSKFFGEYQKNTGRDLNNVINNRAYAIKSFPENDKNNKILKKRGLTTKDTPHLPNLNRYDPSFNVDRESVLSITDEQWQTLKDRSLFDKHYWLKPFSMLDYKYLAKMTAEEHQKALERGLYTPCKNDETLYDNVGGWAISDLCKLSDKQWETVKKRNLIEAPLNHWIKGCNVAEFVNGVVDISNSDWNDVEYSNILDAYPTPTDIHNMLEYSKSEEAQKLTPHFLSRVRMLSSQEKNICKSDKRFKAEYVLPLAKISDEKWQILMEVTENFTNLKIHPQDLLKIVDLDVEVINTLRKRNLLTAVENSYGLKEIALLSDEDWENVKKRGIDKKFPHGYDDWAYLAALTDEQYQLALDKKLFDNRTPNSKYEHKFEGEEIARLVTTLNEKDWENFEKRGLYKDFVIFNGWNWSPPGAYSITHLAKYSDIEFEKFKKIQHRTNYIYPSTVFDLIKLSDEEYQRLMNRNLFKYMNCYEAWDNWTEDAPVMTALAQLNDEDYTAFVNQKNNCKTIAAKVCIINADKIGLDKKQSLNELSFKEKRQYLHMLLNKGGIILSKDFHENYNCTKLIPTNVNEYVDLLNKLVKSTGIDTRPLTEVEKTKFFNALDKISAPNSEFKNLNLKAPDFKLHTKYPRDNFKNDVQNLVSSLDNAEKMKVWDYFGFELKEDSTGRTVMSGYPTLINNGEKLKEIENPQTKEIIQQIKPYVKKFTEENAVVADGNHISPQIADTLNDILHGLPELYSVIGKKQHQTHDYTIDVHSLAVLQECIKDSYFNNLSKQEQREVILAALLHDITKEEYSIDKSHPENSSYDAYYILEKFNLPKQEQTKIYQLIKNHDMLEQCNKPTIAPSTGERIPISPEDQLKKIKRYAYELRSDNLAEIECMFTKADLLSVKRNGEFYDKYKGSLNTVAQKLRTEVKTIKQTAISLPQTKIPKASKLQADGINVKETTTTDKNGNEIKNKVVYMSNDLDLSKYGFDKGVNAQNFNVIVHGFDNKIQQAILGALGQADTQALLSGSYVVYSKGNYHTFRQQGYIMDVANDDIGAAYYRDFGSGCQKNVEDLINNYLEGSNHCYRDYIPNLLKKKLNLTNEQYIDFYESIKDKPLNVLEQEKPYVAMALKDIFKDMEVYKRKFNRNYNEILFSKGTPSAIFFVGKDKDGNQYKVENIPAEFRKFAQDNDLPIIYFGE